MESFGFSILDKIKTKPKQLLVDLHDEPSQQYNFLLEHMDKVDKLLVKSEYHKSLFPNMHHSKFIVIPNGLTDNYFNIDPTSIKKDKHKLIYCSSYDRGLYEMLKYGWPIIKSKVPQAELHLYYGMDLLPLDFKNILLPLLKQEGVYEHGKVSHEEILQAKLKSSIHYYIGCLSETDCISVKESAFTDCIPVVSTNTVFKEKDYCLKVGEPNNNPLIQKTQEDGAKLIVKLLTDTDFYNRSLNKIQNHRDQIESWDNIAKKWKDNFFFQDVKRVNIITNWTTFENQLKVWDLMTSTPEKWNNIHFVNSNDADYTILLNHPKNNKEYQYDKSKTIYIQGEPTWDVKKNFPNKWKNINSSDYLACIGPRSPDWHIGIPFNQLEKNIDNKTKILSTITSSKYVSDGQKKAY